MNDEKEDDQLFDDFIIAHQQMNIPKIEQCVNSMSDEGLYNAAYKIDNLSKIDPGYMVCNTLLFSEFTKRPHLRNPFL
jgi:hypothetical protein